MDSSQGLLWRSVCRDGLRTAPRSLQRTLLTNTPPPDPCCRSRIFRTIARHVMQVTMLPIGELRARGVGVPRLQCRLSVAGLNKGARGVARARLLDPLPPLTTCAP